MTGRKNSETCQYFSEKLKRWKQFRIGKKKFLNCKIQLKELKNRSKASIAANLKQKEKLVSLKTCCLKIHHRNKKVEKKNNEEE